MERTHKGIKNVTGKRGSILFIVLITMATLIALATAVLYAVNNEHDSLVEQYNQEQAYQIAVAGNNFVYDYLDVFFSSVGYTSMTKDEMLDEDALIKKIVELPQDGKFSLEKVYLAHNMTVVATEAEAAYWYQTTITKESKTTVGNTETHKIAFTTISAARDKDGNWVKDETDITQVFGFSITENPGGTMTINGADKYFQNGFGTAGGGADKIGSNGGVYNQDMYFGSDTDFGTSGFTVNGIVSTFGNLTYSNGSTTFGKDSRSAVNVLGKYELTSTRAASTSYKTDFRIGGNMSFSSYSSIFDSDYKDTERSNFYVMGLDGYTKGNNLLVAEGMTIQEDRLNIFVNGDATFKTLTFGKKNRSYINGDLKLEGGNTNAFSGIHYISGDLTIDTTLSISDAEFYVLGNINITKVQNGISTTKFYSGGTITVGESIGSITSTEFHAGGSIIFDKSSNNGNMVSLKGCKFVTGANLEFKGTAFAEITTPDPTNYPTTMDVVGNIIFDNARVTLSDVSQINCEGNVEFKNIPNGFTQTISNTKWSVAGGFTMTDVATQITNSTFHIGTTFAQDNATRGSFSMGNTKVYTGSAFTISNSPIAIYGNSEIHTVAAILLNNIKSLGWPKNDLMSSKYYAGTDIQFTTISGLQIENNEFHATKKISLSNMTGYNTVKTNKFFAKDTLTITNLTGTTIDSNKFHAAKAITFSNVAMPNQDSFKDNEFISADGILVAEITGSTSQTTNYFHAKENITLNNISTSLLLHNTFFNSSKDVVFTGDMCNLLECTFNIGGTLSLPTTFRKIENSIINIGGDFTFYEKYDLETSRLNIRGNVYPTPAFLKDSYEKTPDNWVDYYDLAETKLTSITLRYLYHERNSGVELYTAYPANVQQLDASMPKPSDPQPHTSPTAPTAPTINTIPTAIIPSPDLSKKATHLMLFPWGGTQAWPLDDSNAPDDDDTPEPDDKKTFYKLTGGETFMTCANNMLTEVADIAVDTNGDFKSDAKGNSIFVGKIPVNPTDPDGPKKDITQSYRVSNPDPTPLPSDGYANINILTLVDGGTDTLSKDRNVTLSPKKQFYLEWDVEQYQLNANTVDTIWMDGTEKKARFEQPLNAPGVSKVTSGPIFIYDSCTIELSGTAAQAQGWGSQFYSSGMTAVIDTTRGTDNPQDDRDIYIKITGSPDDFKKLKYVFVRGTGNVVLYLPDEMKNFGTGYQTFNVIHESWAKYIDLNNHGSYEYVFDTTNDNYKCSFTTNSDFDPKKYQDMLHGKEYCDVATCGYCKGVSTEDRAKTLCPGRNLLKYEYIDCTRAGGPICNNIYIVYNGENLNNSNLPQPLTLMDGSIITGFIYAPNAHVVTTSTTPNLIGAIIAKSVDIKGGTALRQLYAMPVDPCYPITLPDGSIGHTYNRDTVAYQIEGSQPGSSIPLPGGGDGNVGSIIYNSTGYR